MSISFLIEEPQGILINTDKQRLTCFEHAVSTHSYLISTAKNGLGEQAGSHCTPRGWHRIHSIIGLGAAINSVFVSRVWTKEIYEASLAAACPERDWILTRILRLEGLEPGYNKGGVQDTFDRYIYMHGTPDTTILGQPGSHGCIRMRNTDVIELANWARVGCRVYIE